MSNTQLKKGGTLVARVLLGLIYTIFGLNYFLHFIPAPPPQGQAEAFVSGLFQSGYFFPFLKGLEVILGLSLLSGLFVPLILVALLPVSLNILLFHAFLSPEGVGMSIAILVLHLFLAWRYRDYYKQLFVPKAVAV
jgi:putative oxidoreductase